MSRTPSSHRGDAGQASVEHAALVALVLVVLTGAVAVASGLGAAGVVNAVHSGIRRAICVAGGDGCAPFHVQPPCAVALDEDATSKGLSLGIWRLGKDRSLAIERRSDDSVLVTAYDDLEGGVGSSVGLRFGIGRSGSGDDDGPFSATAGVEGRLRGGWGRSWEFPDRAAAEAFLRRWGAGEPVRAPDVDRVRLRATAGGSAEASGPAGLEASARVLQGLEGEGTRDRRTGRTTISLAVSRAAAGDLAGPLGLRLGGAVELEPSATLITDGDLRPRELRLVGSLTTRDGTRRRDVQLRVDLTRPEIAQGLGGVLHALAHGDADGTRAAAGRLGRWAADEGWVDQREYRVAREEDGPDVEIGLGFRLGFRDRDSHSSERLVDARTWPPGGLWEDRTDCVAAR
ncbi:hypothetical protein [Patulibacter sp.]|uniref:hypothetical protein n=1 Tax=Patulibacter sp. TaxID=1912859 RepID=UPI00271679CC|nr:hypothetical protein [Patulibacter sp.]MDO9406813.1 hypothetical protein [Patulibacter sp.]